MSVDDTTKVASLVWLRRDLRLADHAALAAALAHPGAVAIVFVFDRNILDPLPSRRDRRVEFIHRSLLEIDEQLERLGSRLIVLDGDPASLIPGLARRLDVTRVVCAEDYEPYARERDGVVAEALRGQSREFVRVQDHVLVDPRALMTSSGNPYTVYTPYRKRWRSVAEPSLWTELDSNPAGRLAACAHEPCLPDLSALGFETTDLDDLPITAGESGANAQLEAFAPRLDDYATRRDYPALAGPSYLSVHLRFGTLSIRRAARLAWSAMSAGEGGGAETWMNELIWRDFYFQILFHFPHVTHSAFRAEMDAVAWEDDETAFQAWCEGRTGYPLVDAAMRQLLHSGYMHNRLRMVTASFLTKDLGIDWRRGEAWFARHLNDFDLAANNGGWQWAASTGCDAQPYFRIFNPVTQSTKFDPRGRFIRRYVPEVARLGDKDIHAPWTLDAEKLSHAGIVLGQTYPAPIVDHAQARKLTLARFEAART
jgi:deoxyribodipyrimidine photo-lyase